jgi:cobalt-zinc-cadmium efflux system protein
MRGREHDLNVRAAFQHMAADALISLGVVVAGAIMLKTGWQWLDPAVSLVISIAIIMSTVGLFKDSLNLALHAVPEKVNFADVKAYFEGLEGVKEVHDLHVWAMSTTETALSVHLLMPGGHPGDSFIMRINEALDRDHHIGHATIQIEVASTSDGCRLASAHVA